MRGLRRGQDRLRPERHRPFDEPEIAIAVVVEKGGTGGAQAPVAVDIINAYFAGSDGREGNWSEGTLVP